MESGVTCLFAIILRCHLLVVVALRQNSLFLDILVD